MIVLLIAHQGKPYFYLKYPTQYRSTPKAFALDDGGCSMVDQALGFRR
jgi:hypothetical protein